MQMASGSSGSYHAPKKTYVSKQPKVKIVNHHNPTDAQIMQAQKRNYHNNYTPPGYVAPKPVHHSVPKPKPVSRPVVHHTTLPVGHGSALPVAKPVVKPIVSKHVVKPVTKTVAPKPTTPKVDPNQSIIDQLNKMYDSQQKTQLDALKASQDKALGQIGQQQKQTTADYYNQKNQADVVSQQNVQRLRELMASNGLNSSGENISANVAANGQRQNALNTLNNSEQQKMDAYQQAITDINDPAHAQAIQDSIAQQRSQALASQMWNGYQFNNLSAAQKAANDWNKYTYGNLSAAQKASNALQWNADQATLQQQQAAIAQQIAALNNAGFNNSSGGGGNYQSDLAKASQIVNMDPSQLGAFNWVIQHESSYNPTAKNPHSTAHGYGQFLNSTQAEYDKKMGLNYNASGANQLAETYQYMQDMYGGPQKAMEFWKTHGWY